MAKLPPEHRTTFATFITLETRWQDNDQYGHMNNVIHYSLIDTAVTRWQMAQSVFDLTGTEMMLMVVESGCRYFAEAGFPDTIHAGLRVAHIGNSSWKYEIGLFRNDEETAFAQGFFAQVQVQSDTGRPEPLSDSVRASLNRIVMNP